MSLITNSTRSHHTLAGQYLALAAAYMYGKPELFTSYRDRPSALLKRLADLKPDPFCRLQGEINEMFPKATNLRLYIGCSNKSKPTPEAHIYISKIEGVWRILSRRCSYETSRSGILRTGVHFIPKLADNSYIESYEIEWKLARIVTGGATVSCLADDLELPEMARQVSHCGAVADFLRELDGPGENELAINTQPGRLVIRLDGTSTVIYDEPWPMSIARSRRWAKTSAKFQVLGHVRNHGLTVIQEPRCILPWITWVGPWKPANLPSRAVTMITLLLESRIVPICGYRVGNWVSIYALSYDEDAKQAGIVTLAEKRRAGDVDGQIPIVVRTIDSFDFNKHLASTVLSVLGSGEDSPEVRERFSAAVVVLQQVLPKDKRTADGCTSYLESNGARLSTVALERFASRVGAGW